MSILKKLLNKMIRLLISVLFFTIDLSSSKSNVTDSNSMYMRIDDMLFLRPEVKTRAGLSHDEFRWPDGIIPYDVEKGISEDQLDLLHEAMEALEEDTCLEFKARKKEENYLHITYTDAGCYAHVGFMNRGSQKLNLGKGCWEFGTVLHELIHSIGFLHEHQRRDRDQYVRIKFKNMESEKRRNFMLDNEMGMDIDFEYFGLPYNFASVMQIAFSVNGKPTIVPKRVWDIDGNFLHDGIDDDGRPVIGNNQLTWGDVTMINRMYDEEYC